MWTKLGDEFADEAFDLSDAAFRTHVEALIYSNRRLLDLLVPKREVRRFASVGDYEAAVAELVAAAWWEDREDTWWIGCKWPEWQRDRSQVEHRRAQWSQAQRRRRRHKVDDHSLCLPDNCVNLKDASSSVSSDDARDDEPDDPGSGRDGTAPTEELPTEAPRLEAVTPTAWPTTVHPPLPAAHVPPKEAPVESRVARVRDAWSKNPPTPHRGTA